jgi:hypothetical protein
VPAAGPSERVDQREMITDVDVGADGTGIDRALEDAVDLRVRLRRWSWAGSITGL